MAKPRITQYARLGLADDLKAVSRLISRRFADHAGGLSRGVERRLCGTGEWLEERYFLGK